MVFEWKGQRLDGGERRRLVNGCTYDTWYGVHGEMKCDDKGAGVSSVHFRNSVFAKSYVTCGKHALG